MVSEFVQSQNGSQGGRPRIHRVDWFDTRREQRLAVREPRLVAAKARRKQLKMQAGKREHKWAETLVRKIDALGLTEVWKHECRFFTKVRVARARVRVLFPCPVSRSRQNELPWCFVEGVIRVLPKSAAKVHHSVVLVAFDDNGVDVLVNPADSADGNPVEQMWIPIESEARALGWYPKCANEEALLKQALQNCSSAHISKLALSWRNRWAAIVDAGGEQVEVGARKRRRRAAQ